VNTFILFVSFFTQRNEHLLHSETGIQSLIEDFATARGPSYLVINNKKQL